MTTGITEQNWIDLAHLAISGAPKRTRVTTIKGTVEGGSGALSVDDDGSARDIEDPVWTDSYDLMEGFTPSGDTTYELSIADPKGAHPSIHVTATADPRLDFVHWEPMVVLDPDATPGLPEAPSSNGGADTPEIDIDAFTRTVTAHLEQAEPGLTPQQVTEHEERLGQTFTAEVRALYEVASAGQVIMADADADPEDVPFYGFEIVPLADFPEQWQMYTDPVERAVSWRYASFAVVAIDPENRVRPIAVSPAWIPFGTDGGGNLYAVDLDPAPGGTKGQVIFLHHEDDAGAAYLAPSITALLAGDIAAHTWTDPLQDPRMVRLAPAALKVAGRKPRKALKKYVLDNELLEVLVTGGSPFDLGPIAGHPRLRTLEAADDLIDPTQVMNLPALQFLSLAPSAWHRLVAERSIPAGLAAAEVKGGRSLAERLATVDEIFAAREVPPVVVEHVAITL